ncbi:MAG: SPFH domain-containing protein [Proteobacteria bacterium]|nr:SPFH domain-containing protein [Pseudomonadota bacterium]
MGTDNIFFLENLEWFDETGKELVHRIPESGSGEIKFGAQLTVRQSQAGVFFYKGKAIDAFGPGRHTLKTANIPVLTKLASIPWAMSSPLRAEVYFVNLKVFTNLKWGTRDPVAFKDSQLGLVRLRAFGVFSIQVLQPVLFINSMVGTQGIFTTSETEDYLNSVIVSRFNDYMGETLDSILNLPARYNDIADGLAKRLKDDFGRFGLGLANIYINSITPPPEVQKAIDDKSRMGLFDDMNKLMQMKAAMSIEKAAEADGASTGMGAGLGIMMPAMFAKYFSPNGQPSGKDSLQEAINCVECSHPIGSDAKFCPYCGHQQLIIIRCKKCGKNLTTNSNFCPRCGQPAEEKEKPSSCKKCGGKNLTNSVFCNLCGEKL